MVKSDSPLFFPLLFSLFPSILHLYRFLESTRSVHPQYNSNDRWVEGMRAVCSSCASWVEDGWLYCMQCGAARPLRPPVNLFATSRITSITSAYEKDRNKPWLEPLVEEQGTKRPSLVRRRQTSDGIHRQLGRVSETPICMRLNSGNHALSLGIQ